MSNYEVTKREAERILPRLVGKLYGNGSLHLDTDTLRLSDPTDRHYLEWLARVTAGFVLEEQAMWEPQVQECMKVIKEDKDTIVSLDGLLEQLRDTAAKEDVTAEELKELIGKYRNPMERYYDTMAAERNTRKLLEEATRPESSDGGGFRSTPVELG